MRKKSKNFLYKKTVIISGASGGLGFSIAKNLIEKYDCKIIGIARNEEKVISAIQTLGDKKDNFSYRLFDVSSRQNWLDFASYLEVNGIFPDIVINNAGFMLPFEKFEKYSKEEIDSIIGTNFSSVIYSTKVLLPLIKKSNTPAIINISSAAGLCPVVGQSMYCATKHGVNGFTQTLQQDYKKQIYIAGIYPGFIKTDILSKFNLNKKDQKLIDKMMMPLDKATKIIIKGISRKKKKIVLGFDGHFMSGFNRIFPKTTSSLITSVLKKAKLEMFDGVFEQKEKDHE